MVREKLFTKDFVLDTAISLCCSLNYFTLLINIAGFATSAFGASSAEAGLAAGLYVIGGLVSRLIFGKYIELVGRKRVLLIGLAFAFMMSGSYFFVSSLSMLYIIRLLHGVSYGLTSSCTSDIVAKLVPAGRRGEGLGYYFLSVTIATAIGPFLGLELSSNGDYAPVFAVGLVMYASAFIFALMIKVPEETLTEEQVNDAKSFSIRNMLQISAIPLAVTCMVFYFAYSGILTFISSYTAEIDLARTASYYYLAASMGTLISRFTTGRIYDMRGPNMVMIPGYIAFIIGMIMFSQTSSSLIFLLAGFIIGYGNAIVYSVCQAIIISRSPAHRYGVATSTFAAIVDMGTGIGPMVLGMMIPLMGFRSMYLMCAFIGVVSFLMYLGIHGIKAAGTNRPRHENI